MSASPELREQVPDGFWVGEWYVEPMRNRIRRDGEAIELEPKVMDVLLCLAVHSETTVTKTTFKDEVWAETVVTDDVLSRCISKLRKAFGDDAGDPDYIETIRKTGYRLLVPVRREEGAPPPDEAPSPPGDDPDRGAPRPRGERWKDVLTTARNPVVEIRDALPRSRLLVLLVVALLLTPAGLYWYWGEGRPSQKETPARVVPFTSFPGEETAPSLSSDGRQTAFVWFRPDSLSQNVYLLQRGAERPLQLSADSTRDWSPAWSPNDRFVAYLRAVRGEQQVAVVPSIGGQSRPLLRVPDRRMHSLAWAPDTSQRRFAVSLQRRDHQAFALYQFVPAADSLDRLTRPPLWSAGDRQPVFSPDGASLAFVRAWTPGVENVYVMPAGGGHPRQLTRDSTTIHGLTWSSDGDEILYSARRNGVSGLWRVPVEGGPPRLVRSTGGGQQVYASPSVQADRLVYSRHSTQHDIWKLSRSSQYAQLQTRSLIASTREERSPSIAPSGRRVAFVSRRSGSAEVWTAGDDGSEQTQVTSLEGNSVRSVEWGPKGNRLCFTARRDGFSDVYVVPVSGGGAQRVTHSTAADRHPRWSPDGRWIYFASNRSGQWELWRTRPAPDSGQVEQVTRGGAVAGQTVPTDSTLYFVRPDTLGIWAVPFDSTALPLDYSGASLLAARAGPGRPAGLSPILARTAQGGAQVRQVVEQFAPRDHQSWGVDVNGIHFVYRRPQDRNGVLAYHDFASGRILPLYEFSDWGRNRSLAVGPEGRWFAYKHAPQRKSDIVMVEQGR
jgi:Tol biopolymer transport system component/DNA-binding winged helix-turn-helix (wHTH) protein